jgi:hypothetical protein
MTKKSRRRRGRQVRLSEAQLARPGKSDSSDRVAALPSMAERQPDLQDEYGRVAADLKRMGIIAAVALVVVIVLVVVLV